MPTMTSTKLVQASVGTSSSTTWNVSINRSGTARPMPSIADLWTGQLDLSTSFNAYAQVISLPLDPLIKAS